MIRGRGPSKAAPSTTCQKCLKKDDYECTATTQERPYKPRPSRTQQLFNPKLVPKLSSDVPNDLLRKKGVADEQLAKLEAERGRAVDRELSQSPPAPSRKRSRSDSSSASSVSTISTNRSRSTSPKRARHYAEDYDKALFSQQEPLMPSLTRKRQRSISSASSSGTSYTRRPHSRERENEERNTRRRRSSVSPGARGRRGRNERDSRRRDRSRGDSMDRSQIARQRLSMTPDGHRQHADDDRDTNYDRRRSGRDRPDRRRKDHERRRDDDDRDGEDSRMAYTSQEELSQSSRPRQQPPPPPAPPRQRSLSPYSRRLALTQAMGGGR